MIAYNRRFLEIWNLDPALLKGDSTAAAESVMHTVVDPEPMKALTAHLYEHPDESGRDEIPLKDGRTIERNSAPIRGADGVNYGRIWFYRDVTEHKRTAEALRFLADASTALNSTLEYETTLANVARLAVPFFADWCAVDMLEREGSIVRIAAAAADPEKERILGELHQRYPLEANVSHPVTVALRAGAPHWTVEVTDEWLGQLAQDDEHLT